VRQSVVARHDQAQTLLVELARLQVPDVAGPAMAGMPAVAMAYLADQVHPSAIAGAVGTFVAGNGLGGR
jgi:hypothetical protein